MLDQVSAKSIRIANKVTKSSCRVCACLLLLITQKFNKKDDARLKMLVENVVVEACITYGEASELTSIPVRITTAFNRSRDETVLKQFLIEEPSMSAKITNQIADLGTNRSILMDDQVLQVLVYVSSVYVLVEIFRDPS